MKKWLDHNKIFHFDESTGNLAIEHIADIQPLIDSNKRLQQEDHHIKDDFRLSARLPETIYYEWMNKYGIDLFNPDHASGVRRLLNSPEYKYLKTTGRVI
jgi:hypothetical protein